MHKTMKYYDHWEGEPLTCQKCQWQGTARTALDDDLPDGSVFVCPSCQQIVPLLFVLLPTLEEKQANRDRLSAKEKEFLVVREAFLADFEARRLKSPDQLPDIDLSTFEVLWDEQQADAGVDVVLLVDARVIHAEPRTWDGAKHFAEVASILCQRYGKRVRDLIPSPRSELYLFGDDVWAHGVVNAARSNLQADANQ